MSRRSWVLAVMAAALALGVAARGAAPGSLLEAAVWVLVVVLGVGPLVWTLWQGVAREMVASDAPERAPLAAPPLTSAASEKGLEPLPLAEALGLALEARGQLWAARETATRALAALARAEQRVRETDRVLAEAEQAQGAGPGAPRPRPVPPPAPSPESSGWSR